MTFEKRMARLDEINELIAMPETGLEESLELYKEGIELAEELALYLTRKHEEVEELSDQADDIIDKLTE